jgi:hypothetical protein
VRAPRSRCRIRRSHVERPNCRRMSGCVELDHGRRSAVGGVGHRDVRRPGRPGGPHRFRQRQHARGLALRLQTRAAECSKNGAKAAVPDRDFGGVDLDDEVVDPQATTAASTCSTVATRAVRRRPGWCCGRFPPRSPGSPALPARPARSVRRNRIPVPGAAGRKRSRDRSPVCRPTPSIVFSPPMVCCSSLIIPAFLAYGPLQRAQPLHEFRQPEQSGLRPQRLPVRSRGVAAHRRARRHIAEDARLRRDRRAIADPDVTRYSRLAAQRHEPAQPRAPGYADLRDHDAVLAHPHVVPDLDQVVDLAAPSDHRGPMEPRSIVVFAPISTSSPMMQPPTCSTFTWPSALLL